MRNQKGHRAPEEFNVPGWALLDKVKDLIQHGNVRRLIIRRPSGKILIDVPLTAGVGVTGILTLLTPMLVALGAVAALVAQFRVEIERDQGDLYDRRHSNR